MPASSEDCCVCLAWIQCTHVLHFQMSKMGTSGISFGNAPFLFFSDGREDYDGKTQPSDSDVIHTNVVIF